MRNTQPTRRSILIVLATLLLAFAALANTYAAEAIPTSPDQRLQAVLQQADRDPADRQRDQRDRPAELLRFAGFEQGDRIVDLFAGGGYLSELLAAWVGPMGGVILLNNAPYRDYAAKDLTRRFAAGQPAGLQQSLVDVGDLQLSPESLDGAVMLMSFHDLYWVDPANGWPKIDADAFIAQVHRALRPGASLLIIDHAAVADSGAAAAQDLHRIDEAFVRRTLEAAGFAFEAELDLLRNPADARDLLVMQPAIRGRTDRFVQRYRRLRADDHR